MIRRKLASVVVIPRVERSATEELGLTRNETDVSIGILGARGVSADQMIQLTPPGGVTSTADEARALREFWCKHPSIPRVIVVTNEFLSRRAFWFFRKTLRELPVIMSPAHTAANWRDNGVLACLNEYLKIVYYAVRY